MSWMLLVLAGLCEIGWAVGLKLIHDTGKPWAVIGTIVALGLSMTLLSIAMKDISAGTAYAVWTGIGAVGVFVFGTIFLSEPVNAARIVSIALVVAGLVGLKLCS